MSSITIDRRFGVPDPAPGTASASSRTADAALLIAAALFSFAPIAVLGPAIGWPASLGSPPAQQLAAIQAAPGAVAAGYGVYMLYSVLVLPVMVLVARRVFGSLSHPLAQLVIAFAALSVLARSIGILRWLTVMPQLAASHAQADPAGRQTIEVVFKALNSYGGGIGELLGVGVFMALSLGVAMAAALARRSVPAWLGGLGLVSAALLIGMLLPALGLAVKVPVAVAATLLSIWMVAFGVWTVAGKREPA